MRPDPSTPTLTAVLLGSLMGISGMGSAAVALALPSINDHHRVSDAQGVWVISAYTIAMAVGTALHGRLGDTRGVRAPLTAGVVMLALGGLLSTLAPTFALLIAARVLQGLGAAAAPTLAIAALRVLYPVQVRLPAVATVISTSLVLTAAGPAIGGLLTDRVGWQATLLFPMAALAPLAVLWRRLPAQGTGGAADGVGGVLVGATTCGVVLLSQFAALGTTSLVCGALLVLAGAPLSALWARSRPQGFLPRAVIRNRSVALSAIGGASVPGVWFGILVLAPAALVEDGWSPTSIGILMLPAAATGVVTSRYAGRVLTRFGARAAMTAGCLLALAAALAMSAPGPGAIVVALLLVYTAFSLTQPAMAALISGTVPAELDGIALGLATSLGFACGGMGAAVAGAMLESGHAAGPLALAAFPLLGLIVARGLGRPAATATPLADMVTPGER